MSKQKVLIIDDDLEISELISTFLQTQCSYEVEIVTDPTLGLEATKTFKPNLILLDIMMPKIDGLELLAQLKNEEETMPIPVIMLTAVGTDEARLQAAQFFSEDYLVKPVPLKELEQRVQNVLDRFNK